MFYAREFAGGEVVRFHMARTVLGQPIYVGTCFWIPGAGVMVDSGPSHRGAQLRAALKDARLEAVLCTHGHEDHVGNNALLGARCVAARGMRVPARLPLYRRIAWGLPKSGAIEAVGDGFEVGEWEFRAVPTPGHAPDHLAYWEPSRGWLFSGDAALGLLRYGFRDEDIHAYMASLRRMRDLRPEVVFPAHGPVLTDPATQLSAQLTHLERLEREARRLAAEGAAPGAIARRLLGFNGPLGLSSGGEFSKRRLIEGLLRGGPG